MKKGSFILFLLLFGIVFAEKLWGEVGSERKSGGYIYSGPAKERLAPYLEKLHLLKLEITERKKQLDDLVKKIRKKKLELAVLETKVATIEKMKRRLYFRRDFDLYVVKEGDTLWSIAGRDDVYGDPMQWEMLYTANRDVIDNPHLIYPGQILIVPRIN